MSLYHTLSHIQRPVRHVSMWMEIGEGGRVGGRERETEMRGREKKRGRKRVRGVNNMSHDKVTRSPDH